MYRSTRRSCPNSFLHTSAGKHYVDGALRRFTGDSDSMIFLYPKFDKHRVVRDEQWMLLFMHGGTGFRAGAAPPALRTGHSSRSYRAGQSVLQRLQVPTRRNVVSLLATSEPVGTLRHLLQFGAGFAVSRLFGGQPADLCDPQTLCLTRRFHQNRVFLSYLLTELSGYPVAPL